MLFRRPDCRPRWRLNDAYHNINLVPLPWAGALSTLYLRGFSLDLNFGKQLNRWYLHRRLFYLWKLKPAGPNSCHFICFDDNLREMHVKIPLKNKFAFNLCCWNSIPHLRISLQGSIFSHFDGFENKTLLLAHYNATVSGFRKNLLTTKNRLQNQRTHIFCEFSNRCSAQNCFGLCLTCGSRPTPQHGVK